MRLEKFLSAFPGNRDRRKARGLVAGDPGRAGRRADAAERDAMVAALEAVRRGHLAPLVGTAAPGPSSGETPGVQGGGV